MSETLDWYAKRGLLVASDEDPKLNSSRLNAGIRFVAENKHNTFDRIRQDLVSVCGVSPRCVEHIMSTLMINERVGKPAMERLRCGLDRLVSYYERVSTNDSGVTDTMQNTVIYVKADYNDADYVTAETPVTTFTPSELGRVMELLTEISQTSAEYNWPSSEVMDQSPRDVYPNWSDEDHGLIDEIIPMSEYGIHSIVCAEFRSIQVNTKII